MKIERKIAVFGCKSTTKFLCEFLATKLKIACIITIDESIALLNNVADYYNLEEFSRENSIQLYYAKNYDLKSADDVHFFKSLEIDLAFVIGWQRLIPEYILSNISIGAFGMHGSSLNLPLGRGRSPMNWALIEGRRVFYTNLFKYDEGIDSGAILDSYKFSINENDNAETMHFKNMLAMQYLIKNNIENLLVNNFSLKIQNEIIPTYYPKRTPDDSLINWDDDIYNIERFIRAVSPPFGGAFTFINNHKVIIYRAQIFDFQDFGYEDFLPGTIVEIFPNNKILVKGFGGLLLVNEYHSEEKLIKNNRFWDYNCKRRKFQINSIRGFDIV
ncbi:formyltransferase family protein [Pelobium sp.]|nr:formyltransferase family protein [Pelobium sp.]MDA9555044.1 formyltransferase family protein [Pelobium sp.]